MSFRAFICRKCQMVKITKKMQCLQTSNNAKKTSSHSFLNNTIPMFNLWNNPDFQSQLSPVLVCSPSVFHIAVWRLYATPGAKMKAAWLCLIACDYPSSSWSQRFSMGLGLEIGLAMTGSWSGGPHSHLDWPGCVAWSIVLLENPNLRVGEHYCQNRRTKVFF